MANITALRKGVQHEPDPTATEELDLTDEPKVRAAAAHDQKVREAFEARRNKKKRGQTEATFKLRDTANMKTELSQHVPIVGDRDRDSMARFIRGAHKSRARGDLIKQHFAAHSAVPRDIDLSRLRVSNDGLRKSDTVSASAIAKLAAAGINIKPTAGVVVLDDSYASNGIRRDAAEVFKGIASGKAVLALPPQNPNGTWTTADPARVGAVSAQGAAQSDPQRAGARPAAPLVGPPASASIRIGRPPGQDLDATLDAIKAAHQNPRSVTMGNLGLARAAPGQSTRGERS